MLCGCGNTLGSRNKSGRCFDCYVLDRSSQDFWHPEHYRKVKRGCLSHYESRKKRKFIER